jgi:hypothetical protein
MVNFTGTADPHNPHNLVPRVYFPRYLLRQASEESPYVESLLNFAIQIFIRLFGVAARKDYQAALQSMFPNLPAITPRKNKPDLPHGPDLPVPSATDPSISLFNRRHVPDRFFEAVVCVLQKYYQDEASVPMDDSLENRITAFVRHPSSMVMDVDIDISLADVEVEVEEPLPTVASIRCSPGKCSTDADGNIVWFDITKVSPCAAIAEKTGECFHEDDEVNGRLWKAHNTMATSFCRALFTLEKTEEQLKEVQERHLIEIDGYISQLAAAANTIESLEVEATHLKQELHTMMNHLDYAYDTCEVFHEHLRSLYPEGLVEDEDQIPWDYQRLDREVQKLRCRVYGHDNEDEKTFPFLTPVAQSSLSPSVSRGLTTSYLAALSSGAAESRTPRLSPNLPPAYATSSDRHVGTVPHYVYDVLRSLNCRELDDVLLACINWGGCDLQYLAKKFNLPPQPTAQLQQVIDQWAGELGRV